MVQRRRNAPQEWGWLTAALLAIAGVVGGYSTLLHVTNPTIVALTFLLIVFGVAARSTLRVAILASLAATACFNFFFLPPTGTWTIAGLQNWFALFTFLVASVVISRLSAQVRARAQDAVERRDELARLFDLTRDILLTPDAPDPIAAIAIHVVRRFRIPATSIFRRQNGTWSRHHSAEPGLSIDDRELDRVFQSATATVEFDVRQRTHAGTDQVRMPDRQVVSLVPLWSGTTTVGILALPGDSLEPSTRDAIAGVIAIAVERQDLLAGRKEAELVRRSAELRSALLASLSHDLRTPLTAITVASNNLDASALTVPQRNGQVDVIRTEVDRLNRLFENIVEMARIETGAIAAEPQWVQPAEIIDAARRQAGHPLASRPVSVDVDERTAVNIDPRLTSTALAHVLENAAQYSREGLAIEIRAWIEQDEFRIGVRDYGPGVPPTELTKVFERFYRGPCAQQHFGTGMGLAITSGLLAAQGGRVWVENHPSGGAVFTLAVPVTARIVTVIPDGDVT